MTAADIARDPEWLAHRYDPVHDAFHFRHVARDAHRRATFLTDEYLPKGEPLVIARMEAVALGGGTAPLHFLLHSAFCCSTLLARAFDIEGTSFGLKEPVVLNDLVGWQRRGAEAPALASVTRDSLAMLRRPFANGETVVVKPSNLVNRLAPLMLHATPNSRALLLHAPLETYLRSIAKKGLEGRLWVRDLLVKLPREWTAALGFEQTDYVTLTDLQVAAVGWLAQHLLFAKLLEAHGPGRVRSLDSEVLMAHPAQTFAALADFYGVSLDEATVAAVVAGPAFNSHSKFGTSFGSAERTAEYEGAAAAHADEIGKVLVWAGAVATNAGVPMQLPGGLV
jgi:hypothetical protein